MLLVPSLKELLILLNLEIQFNTKLTDLEDFFNILIIFIFNLLDDFYFILHIYIQ